MRWKNIIRGRYVATSKITGVTYLISHHATRRWRLVVLVEREQGTDLVSSNDYPTLDAAKKAANTIEKAGPSELMLGNPPGDRLMEFQADRSGQLFAEAVYSVAYRHADDGEDYIHEFDQPDEVKILDQSDRHALLIGDGMDILDTFEVEG